MPALEKSLRPGEITPAVHNCILATTTALNCAASGSGQPLAALLLEAARQPSTQQCHACRMQAQTMAHDAQLTLVMMITPTMHTMASEITAPNLYSQPQLCFVGCQGEQNPANLSFVLST
jgi:hypothetical protein